MIPTMRVAPIPPIATLGWPAWIATLAGFGLLCAILAYWGLVLLAPHPIPGPAGDLSLGAGSGPGRAGVLFGDPAGKATSAAPSLNVTVLGVIADGPRGSAVLSVDGRPGRAFAIGEQVDGALSLNSVGTDRVVIGSGARRFELPAPARPDPAVLSAAAQR